MKYISDETKRFSRRPHYEKADLDFECEDIISDFLKKRRGKVEFPISTDDLTVLIEGKVDDLDSAADLSGIGDDVEGVTDFFRAKKPRVRIAAHLWEGSSRENRLRTTLSHEFGHVHFHNHLYQFEASLELFTSASQGVPLRCKRQAVHGSPGYDWMEWQAGYASGALLMPKSFVQNIGKAYLSEHSLGVPVSTTTLGGYELIAKIASAFQVSQDAARVRLLQLGFVTEDAETPLSLGI